MNTFAVSYKNHHFPPQIIARAVWLYYRFPLSLRLVEEMLLERGIVVSYETIRRWAGSSVPLMPANCAASAATLLFARYCMLQLSDMPRALYIPSELHSDRSCEYFEKVERHKKVADGRSKWRSLAGEITTETTLLPADYPLTPILLFKHHITN